MKASVVRQKSCTWVPAALIWQFLGHSVRDGMKAGTWRNMLGSHGGLFPWSQYARRRV
jgi:hypothetical protein